MIQRLLKYLAIVAVATGILAVCVPVVAGAVPLTLVADAKADICSGIGAAGGTGGCAPSGTSINRVVSFAINTLSLIAGIGAVIMIIIAGMKYITANGDAGNISSAKTSLIYAIVGIVVVAISQFLVQYVIGKVR